MSGQDPAPAHDDDRSRAVDVSVVLPCLNEREAVAGCVSDALQAVRRLGARGEVIVVDNGSSDGSDEVASAAGARVVLEPVRGYGKACLAGLERAVGRYLVLADADGSYDLSELGTLIEPLRHGSDLVIGSRLRGRIAPGAMPWLHRHVGTPLLAALLRVLFRLDVSDPNSGLRGLTKEAYGKLHLRSTGMEFASEMLVRAGKVGLRIAEVPIAYHRRRGASKLRPLRDGWNHLKFMLLYSPTYLFLVPGGLMFLLGMAGTLALLPGPLLIGGHAWDTHAMLAASVLALVGYQVIGLAVYARTYALLSGLETRDPLIQAFHRHFRLEHGLTLGALLFLAGAGIDAYVVYRWVESGFGPLGHVRPMVVALVLMVLGTQTIFSSLFLALLGVRRL